MKILFYDLIKHLWVKRILPCPLPKLCLIWHLYYDFILTLDVVNWTRVARDTDTTRDGTLVPVQLVWP